MSQPNDERVLLTRVLPWASVPVGGIVFLLLLGGLHPSDARRDTIVRLALVLVGLLQLPALWGFFKKAPLGPQVALLIVRLVISVPPILVAGSISHEARDRAPASAP